MQALHNWLVFGAQLLRDLVVLIINALALLDNLFLEHLAVGKLLSSSVVSVQDKHSHILLEYFGVQLYNWEYSRLLKVIHEVLGLFWVAKIVASWKKAANLKCRLIRIGGPQIFANTCFGSELSVVREVIVKLVWLELHVDVSDIKLDVKLVRLSWVRFLPANTLYCSSDVVLNWVCRAHDSCTFKKLLLFGKLVVCPLDWRRSLIPVVLPRYRLRIHDNLL